MPPPPPPPRSAALPSRRTGCFVMLAAPVVGFSPLLIWLIASLLSGGYLDETTTVGTLPWLTFLTMPAGFAVFVVGLVLAVSRRRGN